MAWIMGSLVSAHEGEPAPGPATIETETLPNGKIAVAVEEYPNVHKAVITVYSFSRDRQGDSACTGTCAVTWISVLTTGRPWVAGGIAAERVGVIERPDGTEQVTDDGKTLYLYSAERRFFTPFRACYKQAALSATATGCRVPLAGSSRSSTSDSPAGSLGRSTAGEHPWPRPCLSRGDRCGRRPAYNPQYPTKCGALSAHNTRPITWASTSRL